MVRDETRGGITVTHVNHVTIYVGHPCPWGSWPWRHPFPSRTGIGVVDVRYRNPGRALASLLDHTAATLGTDRRFAEFYLVSSGGCAALI